MAKICGLHISDIHFGALPAERLYNELDKVFFNHIKNMTRCNYVMIEGDLTDSKLSFNDKDSMYLIKFMDKLIKLCIKYRVSKIRVLQGTISHDLNQLENFNHYTKKSNIDFRIIRTVTEEMLFPDFNVLYVPEEYVEDSNEYYRQFLDKENDYYQLIVGHGTFDFMAFVNQKSESEKHIKNAPVFKSNEFLDVTNGAIIFGHIHTPNTFKNIYYISSFSRWCFGEEQPKGFIEYIYSTKSKKFNVKRIENTYARKYVTFDLDNSFKNKNLKSEDKIKIINDLKEKNKVDFIRIKFDKDNLDDEGDALILKDYFSNSNVKLNITNNLKKETTKEDKEFEDKYSFIFNKDYKLETIISKFLETKNINLEEEEIIEILNSFDK